jgi:hypothetical protein
MGKKGGVSGLGVSVFWIVCWMGDGAGMGNYVGGVKGDPRPMLDRCGKIVLF